MKIFMTVNLIYRFLTDYSTAIKYFDFATLVMCSSSRCKCKLNIFGLLWIFRNCNSFWDIQLLFWNCINKVSHFKDRYFELQSQIPFLLILVLWTKGRYSMETLTIN